MANLRYLIPIATSGGSNVTTVTSGNTVDDFFLTNQVSYASTLSHVSAGLTVSESTRAIVRSIHVANVSAAQDTVTVSISIAGATECYLAYQMPIPSGSSVELNRRLKVLNPTDIIKVSSGIVGTMQVTLSWEVSTDTTYFGSGVLLTSSTLADLYTHPTLNSVIESIIVVNYDPTYNFSTDIVWTDTSNATLAYYAKSLVVPVNSSIELCEGPKRIAATNKIRGAAVVGAIAAYVSGKQIAAV